MIFLTTTAIDIDEELLNRCLVLTVNEDREQTQAIHKLQREQQTLEGLLPRQERPRYHEAAPERAALAEAAVRGQSVRGEADVSRPPDAHAPRPHEVPDADPRDRAAAPASAAGEDARSGVSYIEATREDIATADRLMKELLAPVARRAAAADAPAAWADRRDGGRAESDFRFSRRDVREHTRLGPHAVENASASPGRARIPDRAPRRTRPDASCTN